MPTRSTTPVLLLFLALGWRPAIAAEGTGAPPLSPQQRAVDYLAREVPWWTGQHDCFSCHHNGDAARALYTAHGLGYAVDAAALGETSAWLASPRQWRQNKGDPNAADHRLAAIQFASALAAAVDGGPPGEAPNVPPGRLVQAAQLLVEQQRPDGSWQLDDAGQLGSPATYGGVLATWSARKVLVAADPDRFSKPIAAADRWLQALAPTSVLDTSVLIMAMESDRRAHATRLGYARSLIDWQAASGGWGPYRGNPPQVFDTALAILALSTLDDDAARKAVESGRAWLIDKQMPDGGWPETTRPAGGQSYAQHISTSAWATLALMATAPPPAAPDAAR